MSTILDVYKSNLNDMVATMNRSILDVVMNAKGIEVINRILPWTGNEFHAYAWYRSEGLPEFGGLTAEQLVKHGRMDAVRTYLNHTSEGGYA
jgi:hypothetical protein